MSAASTDDFDSLFTTGEPDFEEPPPPEEAPAPNPAEVDRFRGLRLVPIPARMKGPREQNWQTTVYDHERVRAHVASGGNFGVLVGPAAGLAILDVDPKNGGLESFARLQADLKLGLSGHLGVTTGGLHEGRQDGRHYLMRLPADGRRFQKDLKKYPGIEFRAQDGLQCCAVSSLHEDSGLPYRWTSGSEAAFWFPAYDQERLVMRNGQEVWEYNYSPEMREQMRLAHEEMGAVRSLLLPAPRALLDLYAEEEREPAPSTDTAARESFSRLKEFLDQLPIQHFGKTKQFGLTREDWLGVGQALHYETEGSAAGLDLFTAWSKADPNYAAEAERECAKVWKSCKGRPEGKNRTAGFLGELVKRVGGRIPPLAKTPAADDFGVVEEPPAPAPGPRLLTLREFLDVVKPAPPIVDGFLYGSGVFVLFGRWGLGKTYLGLDLGLHVAHGLTDWHGRRLHLAGRVAYLALEGEYAIPNRVRAWHAHHDRELDAADVRLFAGSMNLTRPEARESALRMLVEARPALVFADTLSAAMAGADENAAGAVGEVLEWSRRVVREIGAPIVWLHHPGKKEPNAARGSSTIEANTDGVLQLSRPRGETEGILLQARKVRSSAPAHPLRLRLQGIDLPGGGSDAVVALAAAGDETARRLQALCQAVTAAGGRLSAQAAAEAVMLGSAEPTGAESAGRWIRRNIKAEPDPFYLLARDESGAVVAIPDQEIPDQEDA